MAKTTLTAAQFLESDLWEEAKEEMLADTVRQLDALDLGDDEGRRLVAYRRWAIRELETTMQRRKREYLPRGK